MSFHNTPLSIAPGETADILMPWSEVNVHLGIAGTVRPVTLLEAAVDGNSEVFYAAQVLNADGTKFSFPITLGEAGIHTTDRYAPMGPFFYFYGEDPRPAADERPWCDA